MSDGVGLALFAVASTQKALGYWLNPVVAPLLGMLAGIGGVMLRDLLVAQVPTMLRSDLYAVTTLAGAVMVMVGHALHFQPTAMAIAGAALCSSTFPSRGHRNGQPRERTLRTARRIRRVRDERGCSVMRQGFSTYLRYRLHSSDPGPGANAVVNVFSYGSGS
jgi:hypothetical protein